MEVLRFGFGRAVSGSTFSEGKTLSHEDDVVYWGDIYEADTDSKLDSIEDDPLKWKGTKIEINGSVMFGARLEPFFVAKFTMIEKTEEDYDEDDDEDNYDLPELNEDIGTFE